MASFQFHSSFKKLTYTSKFPTKPERLGQQIWKVTGFRPQERRFLRRPQLAHDQKAAELKGQCAISGETPGDPNIGSAPALLTSWAPSTETVVPMTLAIGSIVLSPSALRAQPDFVRNAEAQAPPWAVPVNLHSNSDPRWFSCTLRFEKWCFQIPKVQISVVYY